MGEEARIELTFSCVVEGTLSELGLDEKETGVKFSSAEELIAYLQEEYRSPADLYDEWDMNDGSEIGLIFWPADPKEDERKPGPGQLALTEGVGALNYRYSVAHWY